MLESKRRDILRTKSLLEGYESEDLKTSPARQLEIAALFSLLTHAGIGPTGQRHLIFTAIALGLTSVLLALILKSFFVLLLFALYALTTYAILRRKSFKRAASFEKDYTALLLSLASAVKTGADPLSAFCEASSLFSVDSELASEVKKVKALLDGGASEEAAIRSFGASINHPDIKLFVTAFILARKEGSSLSESLQRLARVTRQRQSFRRKVRGAVAMQKLSAFGIVGCTVAIGLIQYSTNPQALSGALAHPLGVKAISAALFFITIGIVWMLNISKARI